MPEELQFKSFTVESMNMPFTFRFVVTARQAAATAALTEPVARAHTFLQQIDRDFSTFKPDSLVSKYQRGELKPAEFTDQFQEVYALASQAQDVTAGAFTPFFNNTYDPTGIVKGWAIQRAFEAYLAPLLRSGQAVAAALNGAGDMQVGVTEGTEFQWQIGIQDPADAQNLLRQISLTNGAVATSGISEHGEHIHYLSDDKSLLQASVITPQLITADTFATAAIAFGKAQFLNFVQTHPVHAILIDREHKLTEM